MPWPGVIYCCRTGNIASWKKKEGDEIAAGDSIAEIETDKATMEWEAQDDGFVAKILLEDGAKDVPVGEPAMVVVEDKVKAALWRLPIPGPLSQRKHSLSVPSFHAVSSHPKRVEAVPFVSPL